MTRDEAASLLAFLVAVDGRNLTDLSVDAWHDVLGDLNFHAAMLAAREHYRSSPDWLMPAGIISRAHAATQAAALPPPAEGPRRSM